MDNALGMLGLALRAGRLAVGEDAALDACKARSSRLLLTAADAAGSGRADAVVKNEKSRVAYLARNGWEVASPAESESVVMIPRTFSAVFEEYNELQKQQGFDLSQYCGTEVTMYTYRVTNAEAGGDVIAVLYVQGNRVVGGDVHSTALDGFMTGIVK